MIIIIIYRFVTVKGQEETKNVVICLFNPHCWERIDDLCLCRICRLNLEKIHRAFTDTKIKQHLRNYQNMMLEKSMEAESMKRARLIWNFHGRLPKRYHSKFG